MEATPSAACTSQYRVQWWPTSPKVSVRQRGLRVREMSPFCNTTTGGDALRFLREGDHPLIAHLYGRQACRYLKARQTGTDAVVFDGPSRTPTIPLWLDLLLACMPLLTRFRPRRPAVFRSGSREAASGQSLQVTGLADMLCIWFHGPRKAAYSFGTQLSIDPCTHPGRHQLGDDAETARLTRILLFISHFATIPTAIG
ncbi:hypothetical protein PSPO01_07283 [Paraphaeosphaeria sporulosa]